MKKILFNLSVAILTLFCGIFTVEVFLVEQKPLFEKEIVDIPLYETAPMTETETNQTDQYFEVKDFSAWYFLESKPYKGMPEVEMIGFGGTNVDDDGKELEKMSYDAGIFTNRFVYDVDEGYVEALETIVDGNKLRFKTEEFKGIEYRFRGTFFKNKMTGEENEKVLRGTLQKFIKGKKVAEVSGDFAYGKPHCLL